MKVALIIYSQSGHTALFARAIAAQFTRAGHEADIELLRPVKFVKPGARSVELRKIPDISHYDIILVGGPVWGFGTSPVPLAFLAGAESMKGKRAAAFVTYAIPFKGLGCTAALSKLSNKLDALGAEVAEGEGLFWLFRAGKRRMEEAANRIAARLGVAAAESA